MEWGEPAVLSVVERGWRASRECALDLQAKRIPTIHVIKGRLSREVRTLIQPYEGIRIISVPRQGFWVAVCGVYWLLAMCGRVRAVVVDNERSVGRCRRWLRKTVGVVRVQESERGYSLWTDHQLVDRLAWFAQLEGTHV